MARRIFSHQITFTCFTSFGVDFSIQSYHRLLFPRFSTLSLTPFRSISLSPSRRVAAMDSSGTNSPKEFPIGLDITTEDEYATQSKLLKEFTSIPSIDKAWIFKSDSGNQGMFAMSQADLLANKKRKFMLSGHISKETNQSMNIQWSPFPIEMTGASAFVPSPSGQKLLIIRNPENESPTKFEIWNASQLEKEFQIPQKVHGSVYVDGWFEGISWNSDETYVAYIAEEPSLPKPTFDHLGYKKGNGSDKDFASWKGQGDWEEEWGEAYAGKRQPALFVINVHSGEIQPIRGIPRSLSVGQVVWSPNGQVSTQYLVFVGWSGDKRKLGIKYCYNRSCAIYATKFTESKAKDDANETLHIYNLTEGISSGFSPRFSKDGKFLLFLSLKSAVDSGAHCATESLHRIDWPSDGKLPESTTIVDVIQVVKCPDDDCFPGLYSTSVLTDPWLSDGNTLILSSYWRSYRVILSVNFLSGEVSRISPSDAGYSWSVLALDGDDIVAVSSSPVNVPEIKYGKKVLDSTGKSSWHWSIIRNPIFKCSEKVASGLSSLEFKILKVPITDVSEDLSEGAKKPFEAIYVSSSKPKKNVCDPLVVVLHGGPHSVSPSTFSKSLAYLSSIGNSLLIVNYRGSLGFGEDALQSLPGKVGSQDVNDVLTAIDHAISLKLADPSRITVLGGSHGGFLTTHLIGQAPDRFAAAVARNPVCNIASMVGITDIPDWCFFEAYGNSKHYTEAPLPEDLLRFHQISPISHISKVKTPTLFLLGTQDLRVPISNGFQYVRALKERGTEVKVLVFPNDNHPLDRPQTDFESFLNIAVWFKKYCKV